MSIHLVRNYQRRLSEIHQVGGKNEGAVRRAFSNLLYDVCQTKNLILVEEISIKNPEGKTIRPDGIVKGVNRLDWGYWEAKDEVDDIEEEIKKKFAAGYPNDNIIFEDTQQAILYQNGKRVATANMQDEGVDLYALLQQFVSFERPEYTEFRQALEDFKTDIPPIIKELRNLMDEEAKNNADFVKAKNKFLKICQDSINPDITDIDVREMLVQHILTEDIFTTIFDEADFHKSNNIAFELENVLKTFFRKEIKRNFYTKIRNYYQVIKTVAARIDDVREKQTFLKVIYEDFYKAYNPKGADRLGIVYTPNEIVRFMIESTDHLLYEHFGKELLSEGVEILDPATGTGTFITDLIDYFPSSKKEQIRHKYQNEIHANEVSILPYYIANLNIEYAYQQKTGEYKEFENLVFVDTLDNMGFGFAGKQTGLFTSLSAENLERIQRQNKRKISVIIGNPPYNANQQNENDNNKNREYPALDKRIKDTYIKESTAQKTKLYDMYTRFLRWATDRLDTNGVLAFVSNSSFINSRTFDGFRKTVAKEFNEIWIIDLKGNARTAGEQRKKEGGNVFSDQIRVGVAIYFFIRNENRQGCKIYYNAIEDYAKAERKKSYLSENKIEKLEFQLIQPSEKNNWIDLADNDFEELMAVCSKEAKAGKDEKAIFKLFSLGVVTARDEWVYDLNEIDLEKKVNFLIDAYNKDVDKLKGKSKDEIRNQVDYSIKWSRAVKNDLSKGKKYEYDKSNIVASLYRPFCKRIVYFAKELNEMQYQMPQIFSNENKIIGFSQGGRLDFSSFVSDVVVNDAMYSADYAQTLPLYRYTKEGKRIDNITQWALKEFRSHYSVGSQHHASVDSHRRSYQNIETEPHDGVAVRENDSVDSHRRVNKNKTHDGASVRELEREDIFHYVYGVLHNPAYRKKYELNLKREFPRIPFYEDFWFWSEKGKELMALHLDYEKVEKYDLQREENVLKSSSLNKAKLKADKEKGEIILDEQTTLKNIPASAWEYKLGNRSALEWILDQYKEKKPKDDTIREKFNTYKFEDYKEEVIELLQRVCTVSVKTMEIVKEMESR